MTSIKGGNAMLSNTRIIEILFTLSTHQTISIPELVKKYNVTTRTIQRDIAIIKENAPTFDCLLNYDSITKRYSLSTPNQLHFEETLGIIKILLASRALSTKEMTTLLKTLIHLNPTSSGQIIQKSIQNELTFYHPLTHEQDLLYKIKKMTDYISDKKLINIEYQKNDTSVIHRLVLPISIFFSEYYFYVICYEPDKERYINLRMNRFKQIKKTNKHFDIPYKNRLEEKELREKMLFMYSGNNKTFTFKYSGIVEAALDKFPNSKVIKTYADSSVLIKAAAYDTGTIMWLLSQGSRVEVLSPPSLIKDIKDEISKMNNLYKE